MAARLLTFRGKHPDLITGQMYSSRDYAKAANISPKAMATRLEPSTRSNGRAPATPESKLRL